jgi:nitroreductase
MDNPAKNDFPILDQLRNRWSPRAFSSRPVPPESLASLLEAARWAPSTYNSQPWRFIIAVRKQNQAQYDCAFACLNEWNQGWAGPAPVLMFVVAKMQFENGKDNLHASYDAGQAVASLTVQATTLGLFVHQMAGISHADVTKTYALPNGFAPICGVAIGYPGDVDSLDSELKGKELAERERKPLAEIAFSGSWGQTAAL